MKPYLLFAGDFYYPRGGIDDYIGDFSSEADAISHAKSTRAQWWHVVEYKTMQRLSGSHD